MNILRKTSLVICWMWTAGDQGFDHYIQDISHEKAFQHYHAAMFFFACWNQKGTFGVTRHRNSKILWNKLRNREGNILQRLFACLHFCFFFFGCPRFITDRGLDLKETCRKQMGGCPCGQGCPPITQSKGSLEWGKDRCLQYKANQASLKVDLSIPGDDCLIDKHIFVLGQLTTNQIIRIMIHETIWDNVIYDNTSYTVYIMYT